MREAIRTSAVGARQRRPLPARTDRYHHGDLRAALLAAAEEELAEKGVEGFTLRGCARRAGVSHAAPAHHFKDVRALLTEMAAIGFERLTASMQTYADRMTPGDENYNLAIAKGYVAFAAAHPQHFKLLFLTDRLDCDDPRYRAAGETAFAFPVRLVAAKHGAADPMADPELAPRVIGLWSIVHGFSELMLAGQLERCPGGPITREELIEEMLPKVLGVLERGPAKGGTGRG